MSKEETAREFLEKGISEKQMKEKLLEFQEAIDKLETRKERKVDKALLRLLDEGYSDFTIGLQLGWYYAAWLRGSI